MADPAQQTMENVERQRLQLEESVTKLEKAIDFWSGWETEYEMLKEELQRANAPTHSDMLVIGRTLGCKYIEERDLEELFSNGPHNQRKANQVIDMISKRIDYVQQNRETVEKQYEKEQKLLAGVALLSDPGLENEEGLPIMDIEETLDADDNVISGSVLQPGKAGARLIEALQNAGLHKDEKNSSVDGEKVAGDVKAALATVEAPLETVLDEHTATSELTPSSVISSTTSQVASQIDDPKQAKVNKAPGSKKSVAFADEVDVKTIEQPAGLKEDVKHWNLKPGAKIFELGEDGGIVAKVVVPSESPEEAQLRREMVQYGLSEISDVVAELELEDEDEDDMDDDYDSEESEDEDEYGRSTRVEITDDYRRQMTELEKKLNARMIENVGPKPEKHSLDEFAKDVHTLRVRKDEEFDEQIKNHNEASSDRGSDEKSVRFAGDTKSAQDEDEVVTVSTRTITDTIVERSTAVPEAPTAPSQAKNSKVSRFKAIRGVNTQPPLMLPNPPMPTPPPLPTGPAGRTLASTVVEHAPDASHPQAPDEFDPIALNREISREYHTMRNRMISQQGAFKADESEEDPIVQIRDGETKKVSRFRAAKMKADGL